MHPLVLSALLTMAVFSLVAGVDAWAARRRRDAARRRLSSSPRRIRGGFAGGEVGRRPRREARPSPGVDRCPDEGAVSNSWEYVGTDPDTGQPVYAWICRYPDINHGPAESN